MSRYRTRGAWLGGASFSGGAFQVRARHTYTLVVLSVTRPVYYSAAPAPRAPFQRSVGLRRAGHHRWALGVTMTTSMRPAHNWNLGVRIGHVLHKVRVHVR